jgi:hypothetical protein
MQKLDDENPKELTWEAAAATEITYTNGYLTRKTCHQVFGYVERHLWQCVAVLLSARVYKFDDRLVMVGLDP